MNHNNFYIELLCRHSGWDTFLTLEPGREFMLPGFGFSETLWTFKGIQKVKKRAGYPTCIIILVLFLTFPVSGQTTNNPFPDPIETVEGLIIVDVVDFASIPDSDGQPARMMLLVNEPGTGRMFVNDMRGPLFSVSYDGREVIQFLNINDPVWGVGVESGGRERGFQSFAFHPDFGQSDTPGYGRFYTWSDIQDNESPADFIPGGGNNTHHTILHEWMATDPRNDTYDGGPPRELARFEQPYGNHNAGHLSFNPFSVPGDPDYGLLYVGSADGGSGGDPLNLAQDLGSAFGKILRIDPLGTNSENGRYGIPPDNPYTGEAHEDILGEIYASGMRNPQRFAWDPLTGNLFMADIGQNIVEKVSLVPRGGNLGWNEWEGSYRYISRSEVNLANPRSDSGITYPVVEYGRHDPLMHNRAAVTGVHVYRTNLIPQLQGRVLFADFVSGEILHFDADDLPGGGTGGIRRVLLRNAAGETKTFLELIREQNNRQGRTPATRSDLRFGTGPDEQLFLLNKQDGTIRLLVPEQ
ncbi:MAG: PQQ-dependent sugar dehydrogenase [Balneolales bacterium]